MDLCLLKPVGKSVMLIYTYFLDQCCIYCTCNTYQRTIPSKFTLIMPTYYPGLNLTQSLEMVFAVHLS